MRIALITPDYPPIHGGVAVSAHRVASSVGKLGNCVKVFVPHRSAKYIDRPKVTKARHTNHQVYHVFISTHRSTDARSWHLAGLGITAQLFLILRAFLSKWKPDIIHSFTLFPFAHVSALLARTLETPFVVGVRGNDISGNMFCPDVIPAVQVACNAADIVCPVSSDLLGYLTLLLPDVRRKSTVIPNGIEPVTASVRRVFPDRESICFGTMCDVRPKKDIGTLLEAFKELHNAHAHVRLVVVAVANPRDRACMTAMLPAGSSKILPPRPRLTALELLAGMDVFVIPSAFDGCPNALLEAMSLGKAIIASNVGGAADLIEHGVNGLLFPALDRSRLRACMIEMLTRDRREYLAENARTSVRSATAEAEHWVGAYRSAMAKVKRTDNGG